jgi:hypothetical protein
MNYAEKTLEICAAGYDCAGLCDGGKEQGLMFHFLWQTQILHTLWDWSWLAPIARILAVPLVFLNMIPSLAVHTFTPREIDVIYVQHIGHFAWFYREYKIDLADGKLWVYENMGENENVRAVPRESEAENEGFAFVRNLCERDIRTFRRSAALNGVARWADDYPIIMSSGDFWNIEIVFSNGKRATSSGASNSFPLPLTWDRMETAFERLTGESVLAFETGAPRSPWRG